MYTAKDENRELSYTEAVTLLKEWMSLAESQVCSTEVLSEHLPSVQLLLEDNMVAITTDFLEVASAVSAQIEVLEELIILASEAPNSKLVQKLQASKLSAENMAKTINHIVVSMQFQDRVSQNLVITVNVMHSMIDHLRKTIGYTSDSLNHTDIDLNREYAQEISTHLKLGELKNNFLQHLLDHGYINDVSEIDLNVTQGNNGEDIELF